MRYLMFVLLAVLAIPAAAKEPVAKFKTAEARHYTRMEGVELSPEFTDYLYAELRNELVKTKIYAQVIGEGEAVEEADAPASIVIDGVITEYKKGSVVKEVLIGFSSGYRRLKLETTVTRRSDKQSLATLKSQVRIDPRVKETVMAKIAAKQIAKEIKKALEHHEGSA
ncbi:MAG: DUF4410 domain-containing protein [Candidatus Acidiferrales bacterium]